MFKVSHIAIITALALCAAMMMALLIAQDVDGGYTYETEEQEDEEDEEWS